MIASDDKARKMVIVKANVNTSSWSIQNIINEDLDYIYIYIYIIYIYNYIYIHIYIYIYIYISNPKYFTH